MRLTGLLVRDGKLIPAGVYLLGAIGLLAILGGVRPLLDALPVLLTGERRLAKVVDVRDPEPPLPNRYVVELEFQEKATLRMRRVTVIRRDYRGTSRMREDQLLHIIYDRNNPERFELLTVSSAWQGGAFGILIGVGLLVLVWRAPKTGAISPRGQ